MAILAKNPRVQVATQLVPFSQFQDILVDALAVFRTSFRFEHVSLLCSAF